MEDGAVRRGIDRYEELTCEGEKPLTMLVVLFRDVPECESVAEDWAERSLDDSEVIELLSATGGDDNREDESVVSGCVSGLLSTIGARYECASSGKGSSSFFSLMVITIFSKSSGVI